MPSSQPRTIADFWPMVLINGTISGTKFGLRPKRGRARYSPGTAPSDSSAPGYVDYGLWPMDLINRTIGDN